MYRASVRLSDWTKFIDYIETVLSQSEILLYFRMKAEGKLKVKERKVFLCKELKNIKLNEN